MVVVSSVVTPTVAVVRGMIDSIDIVLKSGDLLKDLLSILT